MIDAYQATTQMTDESEQSYPFTANTLLDRAIGSEGYYGALRREHAHRQSPRRGSDAIVSSAQARGVPVVSSRQMLEWVDGRNGVLVRGICRGAATRSSSRSTSAPAPTGCGRWCRRAPRPGALTGVTRNGNPIATTPQTIKGVEYAFIDAAPGAYEATYDVDQTGPAISNVGHTAGAGTATITWDTNEPPDSRVDYGTSPSALTSSESERCARHLPQRSSSTASLPTPPTTTGSPRRTGPRTRPPIRTAPSRRAASPPRPPASPIRPSPTSPPDAGRRRLRLADRGRRADAEAGGRRGVLGRVRLCRAAGRAQLGVAGRWRRRQRDRLRREPARQRRLRGHRRHLRAGRSLEASPPPSAAPRSSTSASATTSTASGRSSAPTTHRQPALRSHQHRLGSDRYADPRRR